jgi:hypothetical protein
MGKGDQKSKGGRDGNWCSGDSSKAADQVTVAKL